MSLNKISTKQKALKINLDKRLYGTFAEIGAGQEVAAHFFKAGGASGTIAKTMSAYDMRYSDTIYGKTTRYVCAERLEQMLEKEYGLLARRLPDRIDATNFFAFANTVETINYKQENKGHGWLGVRFQLYPQGPENNCVIHVKLYDKDTTRQQEAIGKIGVNLLYACFYHHSDLEDFLCSLVDGLSRDRVEVDLCRLSGEDFQWADNRLVSLMLVRFGLTDATLFGPSGEVTIPDEAFYKKQVVVLRARYRPVNNLNLDMIRLALNSQTEAEKQEETVVLSELTLSGLQYQGEIDVHDYLDRVEILCSLGRHVLISSFVEYYQLSNFFTAIERVESLRMIVGAKKVGVIFDESRYKGLPGGFLEGIGKLFAPGVQLLVYPQFVHGHGFVLNSESVDIGKNSDLLSYLKASGKIADLDGANEQLQHTNADHILEMIRSAHPDWEKLVPTVVAKAIKDRGLFDYPNSKEALRQDRARSNRPSRIKG